MYVQLNLLIHFNDLLSQTIQGKFVLEVTSNVITKKVKFRSYQHQNCMQSQSVSD